MTNHEEVLAARHDAILRVTTEMLSQMPFQPVTVRMIADRVGVHSSTVLHTFDSREAIYAALLFPAYRRFVQSVTKALVPFRADAIRNVAIRYAKSEPLFAHLIVLTNNELRFTMHGPAKVEFETAFARLRENAAHALDEQVPFFLPGKGAQFLTVAEQALAFRYLHNQPPALATQIILTELAGIRYQFPRQANLTKKRGSEWGDALAE